ncbi:MAG: type II toxin-antitoxin system RelE/ParE family toxin [Candidatus Fermentibacteraceae bacterium]|nr:type II toxin-antitoxin system RelE/ParE family toxin [Candidatus Fermentibacteraceae bacterium]
MEKLVTKWFSKWSRKAGLTNSAILESLVDLEKGLSAAGLGKNLFKVRVKREGQGKSSGYRTIVVYRERKRAIFLYGFAKNEKGNITSKELNFFQKLGSDLLKLSQSQIEKAIKDKVLFDLEEVK